jgi:hypothetical protein
MTSLLAGKLRLNSNVSEQVVKEFRRFPAFMDRIEIFDNSIPNDPSPPCKAAAVIHRSKIFLESSRKYLACVSVLHQKIFDYNNRDFQAFQLQNLVDSIATNYLREHGGGIQLTVHKLDDGANPLSCGHLSGSDIAAYCMSKETRDHENAICLPFFRFYLNPLNLSKRAKIERSEISPTRIDGIEGLTSPKIIYTTDGASFKIMDIDSRLRHISLLFEDMNNAVIAPESIRSSIHWILWDNACVSATVYLDTKGPSLKFSGALVVNKRRVNVDSNLSADLKQLVYSEFII